MYDRVILICGQILTYLDPKRVKIGEKMPRLAHFQLCTSFQLANIRYLLNETNLAQGYL